MCVGGEIQRDGRRRRSSQMPATIKYAAMTRPRPIATILATLLTLTASLALCSCDDKSGTGATHQITGKLADSAGRPLSNIKISVFGYPHGTHESFSKVFEISGPADHYSIDVPEGVYDAPQGNITVNYNGHNYVLPLAAADGSREWSQQKESRTGLTRDFVWRISGTRPTSLGESKEMSGFWGASVNMDKGADFGDFGTVEVTLTPDGPLIDGSPGKVLTLERAIPWQKPEDHLLGDIPIGRYVASARITTAGERSKPLRLILTSGNPNRLAEEQFSALATAPKVVIDFEQMQPKPGAAPGQEPRFYVPNLMLFPDREKKGGF
jgi:hypothetical protein